MIYHDQERGRVGERGEGPYCKLLRLKGYYIKSSSRPQSYIVIILLSRPFQHSTPLYLCSITDSSIFNPLGPTCTYWVGLEFIYQNVPEWNVCRWGLVLRLSLVRDGQKDDYEKQSGDPLRFECDTIERVGKLVTNLEL